jgi:predicted transcriptional regulator of viral defense system
LFTTAQAATAGYSPELLIHHLRAGKFHRVQRGIYRVVHFPGGDQEDLVAAWLWSNQQGTFSHQTALFLHELSDVLPARVHLTVPTSWRKRRLRVPTEINLHHANLEESDRGWVGTVPVTAPMQTLADCAAAQVPNDLLDQAINEAVSRGLVTPNELKSRGLKIARRRR